MKVDWNSFLKRPQLSYSLGHRCGGITKRVSRHLAVSKFYVTVDSNDDSAIESTIGTQSASSIDLRFQISSIVDLNPSICFRHWVVKRSHHQERVRFDSVSNISYTCGPLLGVITALYLYIYYIV